MASMSFGIFIEPYECAEDIAKLHAFCGDNVSKHRTAADAV